MFVFDDIIEASEKIKKLREFIEGSLPEILNSFAEVEYSAAAQELRNVALARDKKAIVWQAVNHLQSAHFAFHKVHSEGSGLKFAARAATRMAAVHKDVMTLCFLALSYRYLNETDLMRNALGEAVELLRHDLLEKVYTLGELTDPKTRAECALDVFSSVASWFNPASYPVMLQNVLGNFPHVKRVELTNLCNALGYKPDQPLPLN